VTRILIAFGGNENLKASHHTLGHFFPFFGEKRSGECLEAEYYYARTLGTQPTSLST